MRRWWASPTLRVLPLLLGVLAVSLTVISRLPRHGLVTTQPLLAVPLLAAMVLVERSDLKVVTRRRTHTYGLGELPVLYGICCVGLPLTLLLRLVSNLACNSSRQMSPVKLLGNLVLKTTELAVVALVLDLLVAGRDLRQPAQWSAVPVALLASSLSSLVLLEVVIGLHTGANPVSLERTRERLRTQVPVLVESVACCVMLGLLDDPAGLALFAVLVAGAVVAVHRANALALRNRQLLLLADFTDALALGVASIDVAQRLLAQVAEVCRSDTTELLLLDGSSQLCLRWTTASGTARLDERDRTDLLRRVRAGERQLDATVVAALGLRHAVVAPLDRGGVVEGLLMVADRSDGTAFEPSDVRLVELMAAASCVPLERSRLLDRAREEADEREQAALHDSLTGLANRVLALRHLEQYLLEGDAAVLVLGLDRFRDVNDSLGQDVGDELLDLLGERLADSCAGDSVVARLSGDVFAVLLAGNLTAGVEQAALLAEALQVPFGVGELTVELRATIGITGSEPGDEPGRLLQQAEGAMRVAKRRGVALLLHDVSLADASTRRLALAPDLRRAVEDGELGVVYQPKVDLGTGAVAGVEALVRWTTSRHGFVGPDEFVPLAEQLGLVSALTRHVLDQALALTARTGLPVAVNVSPRGFADGSLVDDTRTALARHGVEPGKLTLELTEGTVMSDPAVGLEVLERLAALGVRLSVDDFGTGYSSLAYLKRLPVHEVKIDRSFVMTMTSDADDAVIVGSTVRLAHDLGMTVVAEGVETAEAWTALRALGCDVAQGYFQSRPVAADDLAPFGEQWPARVAPLLGMPAQRGLRARPAALPR